MVRRHGRLFVVCLGTHSQSIKRALMSSSTVISTSRRSAQSGTTRQSNQAIDDPIRLYLLQMGGIPLLDRDSEVESARRIELWRRRYRNELLEMIWCSGQQLDSSSGWRLGPFDLIALLKSQLQTQMKRNVSYNVWVRIWKPCGELSRKTRGFSVRQRRRRIL